MNNIRYIELLRDMVRTPSLSFEEEAVAALISRALDSLGIPHDIVRGNILALNRHFQPSKPTLALDAHTDTVPACASYTRDPFDPGNDPAVVYGLGSNDDGGSVVSMIAAFRHFFDSRTLPFNLMLILSREEERSGPDGTRYLFDRKDGFFAGGSRYPYPGHVIVGEPTGMRAATSERGLLVLDAHAHGVSGHAARGDGENALYAALDDIARLRGHRFARVSPVMGEVRLNVTQIQAGSAHNVIPDACDFVVDIRPTECYTNSELLEELQNLCSSTLSARNLANRSSATRPDSPLIAAANRLGIGTFSSPTTSDWMRIDADCIKMGPGDSSRSHHGDEYIAAEEIDNAIKLYIKYIETLSNGYTLE